MKGEISLERRHHWASFRGPSLTCLCPSSFVQAFAELRDRVEQEGLYETNYSFYLKLGIWLNFLRE
jgi:hypothetical protein